MTPLNECIITSLDGNDIEQIKYVPYILQDFWEIGTSAEEVIKIIKAHKTDFANLEVLDLGCGKGAISIKISSQLKCKCFGIDAMEDFVAFANDKAKEYSVSDICKFETNDIRTRVEALGKYDIIIMGAVGPVLGDYYATLSRLKPHLNDDGLIIIDDAYTEDDCKTEYPLISKKSDVIKQIGDAGMELIQTLTIADIPGTNEAYDEEFSNLEKRCLELVEKYPEHKNLFLGFAEKQKREYEILSNEITPVMLVIRQKQG